MFSFFKKYDSNKDDYSMTSYLKDTSEKSVKEHQTNVEEVTEEKEPETIVEEEPKEKILNITSKKTDSVVFSVIEQFLERSQIGLEKYGVNLDRTDLDTIDWIQHAQEEHMDAILYLEKLKQIYKNT